MEAEGELAVLDEVGEVLRGREFVGAVAGGEKSAITFRRL